MLRHRPSASSTHDSAYPSIAPLTHLIPPTPGDAHGVNTGTTLWLQSAVLDLPDLDLGDCDVRIEVSGSAEEPLNYDVVLDWHGVLDNEDMSTVQRLLNAWNDQFIAPRIFAHYDRAGHTRLRGEIVMTWWKGHTVAQVDDFVRAVPTIARHLAYWLGKQWPEAPLLPPETVPQEGGAVLGGEDRGVAATEEMASQFITPGNPFGLLRAPVEPATAQRVAALLGSRSGQVSRVDDDGVLRIRWGEPAVNVSVNNGVLTVSTGAEVMVRAGELPDSLLEVTWRWSTNRAGAVCVLHQNSDGSTSVVYAKHDLVGSGMTDEQLHITVAQNCELVANAMMGIADEITGGSR